MAMKFIPTVKISVNVFIANISFKKQALTNVLNQLTGRVCDRFDKTKNANTKSIRIYNCLHKKSMQELFLVFHAPKNDAGQ